MQFKEQRDIRKNSTQSEVAPMYEQRRWRSCQRAPFSGIQLHAIAQQADKAEQASEKRPKREQKHTTNSVKYEN
jgi:hypothetical protein